MEQGSGINYQFKKMLNYFLQGLLYVTPLGLTIYIIQKIFVFTDGILAPLIDAYLKSYLHFKHSIPGLGLILILILITFLGYAGQTVLAKPFKLAIERIIKRAPILHMVYTSIRDFMEAFVGKEKKFNQPVLVKVSKTTDLEKLGFITQTDLSDLKVKDKVAVYFPHSYAFSGELFIVPTDQVTMIDVPAGEMMKFIVSGGITKV
jgi:uncharacterized membrane protein